MKRILLLVTVAAMLGAAMAFCGVAQAKPPIGGKANAKCLVEAVRTLQPGFKPSDYAVHGAAAADDDFDGEATAGPDVFCGFGGDDRIGTLAAGDIFLGGEGDDFVGLNFGTLYGGADNDSVGTNDNSGIVFGGKGRDQVVANFGTFYGGADDDSVPSNSNSDTVFGGKGNDSVQTNLGIFHGGAGDDVVYGNNGTFFGEDGNDSVAFFNAGTFYGGAGLDTVKMAPPPKTDRRVPDRSETATREEPGPPGGPCLSDIQDAT